MRKRIPALMLAFLVCLAAAGCTGASGGTSAADETVSVTRTETETEDPGFAGQTVTLFLVQDDSLDHEAVLAQVRLFEETYGCTVIWETDTPEEGRAQVRTRLAAGTLPDVFNYDMGFRLAALEPEKSLVPLEDEEWIGAVAEGCLEAQKAVCGGHAYLVPAGPAEAAGILYNKTVMTNLQQEIPRTWYEFLVVCSTARRVPMVPVAQAYSKPSFTTLPFEEGWYYVHAEVPDYAQKVLSKEMELTGAEAFAGSLRKLPDLEPYLNRHWREATEEECVRRLGNGEALMMIARTGLLDELEEIWPESLEDVGFFPLPDNSPELRGVTTRLPMGYGIVQGAKNLPLAKELVRFFCSAEAARAYAENAASVRGVFLLTDPSLTDLPVLPAIQEAQAWAAGSVPDFEYFCPVRAADTMAVTNRLFRYETDVETACLALQEGFAADAAQKCIPGWEP